jgi:hypothetical protein
MMSKIIFPRAFAFAVDDLGWNQGSDLSRNNDPGPHRAGVKREFQLEDYEHMVRVGESVGARIQCLFILSEMDRENVLARFPTTTHQRDKWNNSLRINDHQKTIMNYVRDQSAFMEFGLHGTGHEYWAPGQRQKRAEWYNLIDREPWPEDSLREHIQCFKDIMAQYGFSKENGHSFPESFVPCAYSYYWNPEGAYSLGKLLTEVGVKYANTDFSQIPELDPPQEINGGDFDFGTHVINRVNYGNVWYELASLPRVPVEYQSTDMIESHWPNWLAQDDFLQPTVTNDWVEYYRSVQRMRDRYIAKNTEQLHSQWLYKRYAKVKETKPGVVEIDNTLMPAKAYQYNTLGNLVLKIKLEKGQHLSSATLLDSRIACYFEDEGYAFIYLPPLERRRYTLMYSIGETEMSEHIFNDGTYNVYGLEVSGKRMVAKLKIYGTQTIRIRCSRPVLVQSLSDNLSIRRHSYFDSLGELRVIVSAKDMQGSVGELMVEG